MLKTDFFRFFRFIGSWWSVKPLKLTTKIVIKTIIISGRSASQPWASCCLKSSLKLSDRIQPPAPVLLSNELNFASLARIELDQCLLNWPRPAGLSRNFGLLDQGGPPCVGPNYLDQAEAWIAGRMRWISNRCISELCPVSFQNCKDPRLTFHKDLGGGAHTHPTVLVTKINLCFKRSLRSCK